jgi:hypothetical protein
MRLTKDEEDVLERYSKLVGRKKGAIVHSLIQDGMTKMLLVIHKQERELLDAERKKQDAEIVDLKKREEALTTKYQQRA